MSNYVLANLILISKLELFNLLTSIFDRFSNKGN